MYGTKHDYKLKPKFKIQKPRLHLKKTRNTKQLCNNKTRKEVTESQGESKL